AGLAEDRVHRAQRPVRRRGALERRRQEHRVGGVGQDGELARLADENGLAIRAPVAERLALRAGIAQKGVPRAPAADLQQLLAEHALEHPPRQALLVREAAPAERRRQPVAERLRTMSRAVGHTAILAARRGRRGRRSPRVAPALAACCRTATASKLDVLRRFPICEPCRLPTAVRSVRSLSMHSNEAGGSTQTDNEEPSSPRRLSLYANVAAALAGGLLAGCQTLGPPAEAPGTHELISPLADAVIGDPASVLPLSLEPATRLP